MKKRETLRPPNSLILVRDAESFEVPEWSGRRLVEVTSSCLAVGTLAEPDGETTISLGGTDGTATLEAFDGEMTIASKRLVVATVIGDVLLEQDVPRGRAGVRVLVNHAREPDAIMVLVSPA